MTVQLFRITSTSGTCIINISTNVDEAEYDMKTWHN